MGFNTPSIDALSFPTLILQVQRRADATSSIFRSMKSVSWKVIKLLIRARFPTVRHISTAQLAAWLEQEAQPLLLDARTPQEYSMSHLERAQLVPANAQTALPGLDSSTPIVTYCSIGYRSARLAQQLQSMGYKNVFNLEGSIFQWANEGRPVYREQQIKQVHPYNRLWGCLLRSHLQPEQWQAVKKNE